MKRFFRSGFLALILLPFLFCIAQAQLEHFGLPGERINALAIVPPNPWPPRPRFAAATDSNGLFLRDISSPDSLWRYFGLNGNNIKSLYIQHWGAGPIEAHRLFAGTRPNKTLGDSTFLYVNPLLLDTTWIPADMGLDANVIEEINAISAVHYFAHTYLGPVFISAGGKIYRSYEPATHPWEDVWPQPGPLVINVIQIHQPIIWWFEATLWIGGETSIFWPYLAKSTDHGDNWEFYYPNLSGDNACNAIAIVANSPETVYAGMEGAVIKTTDGGQNWEITALQNTPYYFNGIVANPNNPDHVIAGGVSNTGLTALYETYDGGDTWQDLQPPSVAAGVSCMVADTAGSEFVVYIGTLGNGVYRYISPLVGIDEQPAPEVVEGFQLYQNYPNPFNPETAISYQLSAVSNVELLVYNSLGQKIRTLVSAQRPAGRYEVTWDGRDDAGRAVGSGVYIYRLKAGKFVQSRQMLLVR